MGELVSPRLGRPPLAARWKIGLALGIGRLTGAPIFADWLTSPRNTHFAQAIVNRVCKNFMGVGADLNLSYYVRDTNPPTNDELFNALTADFVKHGFDIQYLIRMHDAIGHLPCGFRGEQAECARQQVLFPLPDGSAARCLLPSRRTIPKNFRGFLPGLMLCNAPSVRMDSDLLSIFGRPQRLKTSESERLTHLFRLST